MPPSVAAIEIIPVFPKLAARYAHRHQDYWTIDHRDFYKVTTQNTSPHWLRVRCTGSARVELHRVRALSRRPSCAGWLPQVTLEDGTVGWGEQRVRFGQVPVLPDDHARAGACAGRA